MATWPTKIGHLAYVQTPTYQIELVTARTNWRSVLVTRQGRDLVPPLQKGTRMKLRAITLEKPTLRAVARLLAVVAAGVLAVSLLLVLVKPAEAVPSSPVLEYLFNEGSGTTATNTGTAGAAANGSISGPLYSADTPQGSSSSLDFDGAGDFVQVQDAFDYGNQLTVEAWIKPDAMDGQRVIWDDYGNPGVLLVVNNGKVQFQMSTQADPGPGAVMVEGTLSAGQWQHVAGVYDGSQMRVYINGVDTGTVVQTSGSIIDNGSSSAAIGSDNNSANVLNFDGKIDDFRIWSGALQPSELAGGQFDGLVAYYPFSSDTKDASGNGHDGTRVGSPTFSSDVPTNGAPNSLSLKGSANGSDDYVSVPDDPALDFDSSTPMTISLWAKKSASPGVYHILGKRDGCGGANYQLAVDSGGFHFNSGQTGPSGSPGRLDTSVNDLTQGEWTHLAVTYDTSKTLALYVDGANVGSASNFDLGAPNDAPLEIGASGTCSNTFPGFLDEVRIYNRALNATEVGSLAKPTPSDATKPTITVNSPTEGASYKLGESVTADYSCSDDTSSGSDLSCEGTVPNGSALDTSSVGPKAFTVTSTDKAGNTETKTVNYSVVYNFSGFYQPVDNLPTLNKTKGGKSIPVRFSLQGDQGSSIFAAGYPKSQQIPCGSAAPVDGVEETTTGSSGLTYDPLSDRYEYRWATQSAWAGTCRQLVIKFADETTIQRANFDFRK